MATAVAELDPASLGRSERLVVENAERGVEHAGPEGLKEAFADDALKMAQ